MMLGNGAEIRWDELDQGMLGTVNDSQQRLYSFSIKAGHRLKFCRIEGAWTGGSLSPLDG